MRKIACVFLALAACDVAGLQFGCNPRGSRCSYWVRNLVVKTAKETKR